MHDPKNFFFGGGGIFIRNFFSFEKIEYQKDEFANLKSAFSVAYFDPMFMLEFFT